MSNSNNQLEGSTSGWVAFAGYLMVIAGFFQMIAGMVAVFKPSMYVATSNHLLVLDYTQWGWVHFLIGLILALSAASLFAGKLWGRLVAVFLATVSAVLNFGFISAYPIWSIMIIVLDIVVIYSVAMHGGQED